jgi:outer membrane lipoprotein-sorting protein
VLSTLFLLAAFLLAPFLLAAALGPAVSGGGAAAAPVAGQSVPGWSEEDAADIARLERYLNNIRTMRARFLQTTSDGGYAEGTLYIARPGRLRIEYDPPVPVLIVSDGTWLHYYDDELRQANRLRLSDTPAAVLVRDRFDLGDTLSVVDFERGPASLRITLEDPANPDAGRLTLTFSDRPLVLRHWIVIDPQGIETKVALYDTRRDVVIPPQLFEFEDPTKRRPPFGP